MTLTCREPDCNGAVALINDNGVTDPANGDRWEEYECANCGHTFTKTLKA
jgi:hypothetical protein